MKTNRLKPRRQSSALAALSAAVLLVAVPAVLQAAAFTPGNLVVFSADSASANNTTFSIIELNSAATSSAVQTIAINGTSGSSALRTSGTATSTGYLSDSDDGTLVVFTAHNTTTSSGNINVIAARGIGTLNDTGSFALQTTYTGATSGQQTRGACSANNSVWWVGDQTGIYTNNQSGASGTPRGNYRSVKSFGGTLYVSSSSASPVQTISGGTTNVLNGLSTPDANMVDFYMVSSGNNGSTFDVLYTLDNTNNSTTAGAINKYSLVGGSWTANGSYPTGFGGFGLCAAKNGIGVVLYATSGTGSSAANSVNKLTDTAGFNSTISISTGNNVTLYTAAAGTTMKGIAFAPIAAPAVTASAATAIDTSAATLNGNVTSDGGATVTDRGFVFKSSAGVTIGDNKTPVAGTTGAFSLTPALSVNAQYFFKAYAINSAGTALSSEFSFWTLANVPAAPTVNGATTNTLNVAIGSGDGNPAGTAYLIQETNSGGFVQADGALGGTPFYQTASVWGVTTVTNLIPGSAYAFQVRAANGAGISTAFGTATGASTAALTVNKTAPTFNLSSSANPCGFKCGVTFTANNILPADVTGTIQFTTNGGNLGGPVVISGGSAASIAATGLPRDPANTIQAVYSGDANYLSVTNTLTQSVTNHPPVAVGTNFIRCASVPSLDIAIGGLLANVTDADGDSVSVVGAGTSTNGIILGSGSGCLSYCNSRPVDDQFTVTFADGFGGTGTAVVSIIVSTNALGGQVQAFSLGGGGAAATLNFAGVPTYGYAVQRATNLTDWVDILLTNAPASGVFQFIDDLGGSPPDQLFYRLRYNP